MNVPIERPYSMTEQGLFRCKHCSATTQRYDEMVLHLAVVHGIRPVKKERLEWLANTQS